MMFLDGMRIRTLLPMSRLIDGLSEAFSGRYVVPQRSLIRIPGGNGERLLLSMPAFDDAGGGAVKLSTVYPDNRGDGLPTIQGVVVVFSERGVPMAVLDGTTITRLRTAAASALASSFLSRADSSHLVIVGSGALAPDMAAAHCVVRPIRKVSVCARRDEQAERTAETIRTLIDSHIHVHVSPSIEAAVKTADIVSCATSSSQPVLMGRWLSEGTFVDLVGSFSPAKRESDDEVVLRSRIFVDTFEGAFAEAGDVLDPLARGIIDRTRIEGELADLVAGRIAGRRDASEIILFKSVGTAIEDLAAARMVVAAGELIGAGQEPHT
jgi:alanine dehydrogenase